MLCDRPLPLCSACGGGRAKGGFSHDSGLLSIPHPIPHQPTRNDGHVGPGLARVQTGESPWPVPAYGDGRGPRLTLPLSCLSNKEVRTMLV